MKIDFDSLPKFQKEFRRLAKKNKSLPEDLREFCNVLSAVPLGTGKHFAVVAQANDIYIVKARFFCRCLKGSSLRIVYAYFEMRKKIEFIELYSKDEKEAENAERIKEYLKNYQ
jgi:hypothetical protein